ncbi:MAG: hypothetical protein HUJ92_08175 [Bacteroidales bacterium]|nr:hypothetical protein [Bacteroidales bacterium]
MKNNYLFPTWCKTVGIVCSIPFLLLGILFIIDSAAMGIDDLKFLYDCEFLATLDIIALSVTLMMVAFAREKDEDELTTSVRASSLVIAVEISYVIIFIAALCLYEFAFLSFLCANLFSMLILYIIIFNCRMNRIRKEARNEK